MRLFAITIIPHHRCAILSLSILLKTTRPRAYLLPHWKLLFSLFRMSEYFDNLVANLSVCALQFTCSSRVTPRKSNLFTLLISSWFVFKTGTRFDTSFWYGWNSINFVFLILTLNVRGPSYLGLTRSIPWLHSWPGHQQPWYWLCRIGRSLSYLREDFNYLCIINVEQWHKM